MVPTKIKQLSQTELSILWDDNHESTYTLQTMRDNCPCASCKVEIETYDGKILLPILVPGKYDFKSLVQVGSYAIQITWGDGHKTGIYAYAFLRGLCECDECKK